MRFLSTTLLLLALTVTGLHAQEEEDLKPQDLSSQYQNLKSISESYGEYKVIKEVRLDNFWTTVIDSISITKDKLSATNQTIASQNIELTNLQVSKSETEAQMALADHAMTHITFMGVDFTKSNFVLINVISISGLMLLLAIGLFQYRHNKNTALSKIKDFDELQLQFEEFKKVALEKNVKLNRELQTERNIVEEMHSKTTITKKITA